MPREYERTVESLFEDLGFFVESSQKVRRYLPRPVTPDFFACSRSLNPALRALEADPEGGDDRPAKANVFAVECTSSLGMKEIKNTVSQCVDYAALGIPAYLCVPSETLTKSLGKDTVLERLVPLLNQAGVGLLASEPHGIDCVLRGRVTLEGSGKTVPHLAHLPVARFRVDSAMMGEFKKTAGFKVDPLFVPSSIWLPMFAELSERNRLAITLEFRLREEWLSLPQLLPELLAIRKKILAFGEGVYESWVVSEGPGENSAVVGFDLPSLLATLGEGNGKFAAGKNDRWPLPTMASDLLASFSPKWYQCHFAYAIFFRSRTIEHDVAYLSGEIRFGSTEVHIHNFEIVSQRINLDYLRRFRKWATAIGTSSYIEELDSLDFSALSKYEIVDISSNADGFIAACKEANGGYFPAELIGRAKFLGPVTRLAGTAPILETEVPQLELGKYSTGNAVYRYAGPVVWSQMPMLREQI